MSEPLGSYEFGTAEDYHELNAGAHRKPPKNLNAPALVWHVACWTKTDRDKQDPNHVKDTVDSFILTFCRAIEPKVGVVELDPCISGVRLLFNSVCKGTSFARERIALDPRQNDIFKSTSRAVSVKFEWHDLNVAVRFEIHTEYLSISTFVELDKKRTGPPYSTLPDLNKNIGRMLDYLGKGDKNQAKPLNKYFFKEFWKSYETDILSDVSLKTLMQADMFMQVFADFRGLVLSEQAVQFPGTEDLLAKNAPLDWGGTAKSKFLPLIQDQRRYECAVNYVLDGRAFYMSTLGPQLPSVPVTERIPLEFIVYANQRSPDSKTIVNKWELGRIVDRLLLLGTLRLCALRQVTLLHQAGRELGLLDASTQKAREAIAAIEVKTTAPESHVPARSANATNPPSDGTELNDEKVMELIGAAHKRLNGIAGDFLKNTGSGLLYRIERSRYYVKQFNENVELLRIKRLEGDQPYHQFIKRRLGSEFDFIDRLGIRYERATRNMVTLDQNYLAMKANQIDEDIHTIQKYGELLLLAVLAPYYVTHMVVLICGEEYAVTTAANIWIVFFVCAIANFFKIWPKYLKRFRLPGIIAVASVIALVGGTYLMLPFEMMLWNRQHDRYEQKLTETVDREVRVLKKLLLETQQRPPGSAPPAAPAVPTPNSRTPDKGG